MMFSLQSNKDARRSDEELSQMLRDEIARYAELNAELRRKHKEADDIIKETRKLLARLQREVIAGIEALESEGQ